MVVVALATVVDTIGAVAGTTTCGAVVVDDGRAIDARRTGCTAAAEATTAVVGIGTRLMTGGAGGGPGTAGGPGAG